MSGAVSSTLMLREDTYRILAACFYPPVEELFTDRPLGTLAPLLSPFSPGAADLLAQADRTLASLTREELAVEHARLFVGPFRLPAPPYGSCHLEESKSVMGETTVKVAAFYRESGLELAEDFHELPDHVAAELEFMSWLSFREREALAAGDREGAKMARGRSLRFLQTFLSPWIDPFTRAVVEDGESPFHVAVARALSVYVGDDLRWLREGLPDGS